MLTTLQMSTEQPLTLPAAVLYSAVTVARTCAVLLLPRETRPEHCKARDLGQPGGSQVNPGLADPKAGPELTRNRKSLSNNSTCLKPAVRLSQQDCQVRRRTVNTAVWATRVLLAQTVQPAQEPETSDPCNTAGMTLTCVSPAACPLAPCSECQTQPAAVLAVGPTVLVTVLTAAAAAPQDHYLRYLRAHPVV